MYSVTIIAINSKIGNFLEQQITVLVIPNMNNIIKNDLILTIYNNSKTGNTQFNNLKSHAL